MATDDFHREIVRSGESFLDGQLKVAASADQRASGLTGMFIAAATASLAVTVALANPAWQVPGRGALIVAGATAAVFFLIGALQCLWAIMPTSFYLPGCEPENWQEDRRAGRDFSECLDERAAHIQSDINANRLVIEANAKRFRRGALFGMSAPFLALLVWFLSVGLFHQSGGQL